MKNYIRINEHINKYKLLLFQYIPVTFLVFTLFFMLLKFPSITSKGISEGIDLCLSALVPTLYPFMILCSFFVNSNLCEICEKVLEKITYHIFRLSGKCAVVIFLSMIAGLPIGGKMTASLYENGKITRNEGQRLLLFCICPGPAFVISTVGYYMLGSKKAGVIIYFSVVLSNLITGFISRFFTSKDKIRCEEKYSFEGTSLSTALVKSVSEGSLNMLLVCAWVVLFSCLSSFIGILPLSEGVKLFLYSILEITNGCSFASGKVSLPVISGIITFAGLCGHFQIMSAVLKLKLKIKHFLTARIINSALSVIICHFMLQIFPITDEVFAFGVRPENIMSGVSKSISVCMIVSCVLFLLGDNFKIKIGKKGKTG